jgi:retron-type reverse transcriptase
MGSSKDVLPQTPFCSYNIWRSEDLRAAIKGARAAIVYFDIAKAFDTVHHQTTLNHLTERYSLPYDPTILIRSYLSGRVRIVKVANEVSEDTHVSSGLLQGSVLGPLLFVPYINDITKVPLSACSYMILYANDMALIHPLDTENAVEKIQEDMLKMSERIGELKLRFNETKCKF